MGRHRLLATWAFLLAAPLAADGGTIVIRPSEGPSPERRAAVGRWLDGAREELGPVLAGWAGARRDLERWPRRGTAPGCRSLARAVPAVDASRLAGAPDPRLAAAAVETLRRLGEAAGSCLGDRYFDAAFHLDEAMKAWLRLARDLRRYRLRP